MPRCEPKGPILSLRVDRHDVVLVDLELRNRGLQVNRNSGRNRRVGEGCHQIAPAGCVARIGDHGEVGLLLGHRDALDKLVVSTAAVVTLPTLILVLTGPPLSR